MSSPGDFESTIAEVIFSKGESEISLNDLTNVAKASAARTRDAIQRLKMLGYPLHLTGAGIIERLPFSPIDTRQLGSGLATERIGRRIEWRLHVRSTQDELEKLENEADDGTVLVAETQYGGKGRLARGWFSPVGGIWMSVLLRPAWHEAHQVLTLAFAAAACRAISDVTSVSSQLKWPNDLTVRSRKVGGILARASYVGSRLDHLIVGLGVNVNIKMARFPKTFREASTSLNHEVGRDVDRALLTKRIIEEMDRSYRRFEMGRIGELLDEARRLCSTLGRKVRVAALERNFVGHAVGLGDDGQLLVRLKNGAMISFYAADVVHLR